MRTARILLKLPSLPCSRSLPAACTGLRRSHPPPPPTPSRAALTDRCDCLSGTHNVRTPLRTELARLARRNHQSPLGSCGHSGRVTPLQTQWLLCNAASWPRSMTVRKQQVSRNQPRSRACRRSRPPRRRIRSRRHSRPRLPRSRCHRQASSHDIVLLLFGFVGRLTACTDGNCCCGGGVTSCFVTCQAPQCRRNPCL